MHEKRRWRRGGRQDGEHNVNAKLTEEDVALVRASNLSSRKLAKQLGIGSTQILNIRAGRSWRTER